MQMRVFSNAIWNVVNGSSSALVAVIVPPFLTHSLGPEAYGAWALALQVGTCVSLFGFGIQMAVGRYVAFAEARGDLVTRDGVVSSAFWFLVAASSLGWAVICCISLMIRHIVPSLSPELLEETRAAIILVGLALAVNLPASVFAAVFTGVQRSDIPAKIQGVGRVVQALLLIAAGHFQSLTILSGVYVFVAGCVTAALWYSWRSRMHAPTLSPRNISRAYGAELFSFCLSLTLWNFSMLLVGGLDLIFVGRFDYVMVPFFAVSVTLATLASGTLSSLANALVPAAAALPEGGGDEESLRLLLNRSSRLLIGVSVLFAAPMIYEGRALLGWWLGDVYAVQAAPILMFLMAAALIRNAMLPYVTLAIGIGRQRKMIYAPLIEALITMVASLIGGGLWGALGVAGAKLVGGVSGVSLILAQHAMRDRLKGVTRTEYLLDDIIRPAMALIPPSLAALILALFPTEVVSPSVRFFVVGIASAISVWYLSFSQNDRIFARALVTRRARLAGKGRTA